MVGPRQGKTTKRKKLVGALFKQCAPEQLHKSMTILQDKADGVFKFTK